MLQEEKNLGSTSALSLDKLESLESPGARDVQPRRFTAATKKRKRTSYTSQGRLADKLNTDVSKMLGSVPKIKEHFNICDKIGEGTFSSVYRATLKQNPESTQSSQEFALKHIIPTSHPDRILSELSCLVRIGGLDNVMGVKLTVREKDNIVIVMPYFRHNRFQDFYHSMSVQEVREYLQNLFVALQRVHKFDIIHRDVKPGNFLYDREARKYALVDFGLAQAVPKISRTKLSSKVSAVGGVLHNDTPRPPQPRKNVRRTASATENKKQAQTAAAESKRTLSESRSAVPRLAELDPNTFGHSTTERSSRERSQHPSQSLNDHQLKKSGGGSAVVIPRGSENIPDGCNAAAKNPKPVILTRKGTAATVATATTRRGTKKAQEPAADTATKKGVCGCFGLPQVCDVCMARKNQVAPRAGTPGFRSPEVLLKCPDQTTAVDMWAAGVIFLSILSGRYPFFRAPDDLTALAQIMSIMGTQETKAAAETNGKNLQCSVKLPAMDLKVMCRQLRLGATQQRHTSSSSKRRRSNGETSKRRRRSNNGQSPPQRDNGAVAVAGGNADPERDANGGSPASQLSDSSVAARGDRDRFPDSAYDLLRCLLELDPKKRITAAEALGHPFLAEEEL